MSTTDFEELIRLPEETAVQTYFDRSNSLIISRFLPVLALGCVIAVIGFAANQLYLRAALWAVGLVVACGVFLTRQTRLYLGNARAILMGILLLVLLLVAFSFTDPAPSTAFAGFVFPTLLIFFRMRTREYAVLAGLFLTTAAWFIFGGLMIEGVAGRIGLLLSQLLTAVIALAVATRLTRNLRNRFSSSWRRELQRDTESRRMRSELHDAREIQLSMLPKSAPNLDWLDYSSVSLPATEVGGDYFEYFVLTSTQLALVIGDVAGHGVASGLVLSGVRSGLHLLRDQLTDPLTVLARLNEMVRDTAPVRMFVTLQIALLDYGAHRVTLANAGHPPMLRRSSMVDQVERIGSPGLPLGTGLEPGIDKVSSPLERGDTLVFYTDGLTETRDLRGETFGEARLVNELERSSRNRSARLTRDSLLNAISSFKADVVQEDDLTLLVLGIR